MSKRMGKRATWELDRRPDVQGSMRQRGDAWELRVYVGRDPLTNRKRWSSKSVRCGKREAQRALAAMVADLDDRPGAPAAGTVKQLLDQWFENTVSDLSPKSAREDRGYIDRYLIPGLGPVQVSRLRTEDIDRFYRELRRRGGTKGKPLSPATVKKAHGILHRALEQAVRWSWIRHNPASDAQVPRVPLTEIKPPKPDDVARLFLVAQEKDPDLAAFILVAAATGARRSELTALRWSDVDTKARRVFIARGIVAGPDGLVEKDTKTHAARNIALDSMTSKALAQHRATAEVRAQACGTRLRPDAFVFSREADSSAPWRPDSTSRAFTRLVRKNGGGDIRLHDLRHYVATRLLGAGVDVRTVAGRLGHRNASTTLNVYAHFLQEADEQAASILGAIMKKASGPGSRSPQGAKRP
jgi:integrase